MRIVYIHQYYVNRDGWGGTRSFEVGRRLVREGHEVHVLTTDIGADKSAVKWRHTRDEGIDVHRLPVPYSNKMSYARRIRAFVEFAVAAAAKATTIRADLVLATSTPLTVAVPGVIAAKLRRVPFVFEVRDLWPEVPIEMGALRNPVARRLAGALATFAYRNANEIVALSPGMAAGVLERYPKARTTVIPNACDLDLFTVDPWPAQRLRAAHDWLQDRPLVVYTGSLGAVNGIE
jgi:glycosyltransferase involved in cell wall biosynthesis